MRLVVLITFLTWLLWALWSGTYGLAQGPTNIPTPSLSDLNQQLEEVGCRAERQAAVQTIVQLRDQIAALQKQLAKDPPAGKSGATKH